MPIHSAEQYQRLKGTLAERNILLADWQGLLLEQLNAQSVASSQSESIFR